MMPVIDTWIFLECSFNSTTVQIYSYLGILDQLVYDLLNNYICEERDKERGGTPAKVLPYLLNQED